MVNFKATNQARLDIELPDKKYFTIGEVSELCSVKSHVLRYWEQVFAQLDPSKRRGRRYYQHPDIEIILEIKSLLYDQGFTIPGAKERLSKSSNKGVLPEKLDTKDPQKNNSYLQLVRMRAENQEFFNYISNKY
jgi:DNA-binding transcriptional MerR regulator